MSRRESADRRDGGYSSMKEMLAKEQVGKSSTYLKLPKNTQLFKLKAGIMFIDIMPFIAGKGNPNADEGMRHWERTFYVHKSVGVDNEMFLCLAKTLGEKCPICEFRSSLAKKAAGDDDAFELAKALEPKERQLFNVIDTKAPDKGIQVWDISKHLFGKDLMKEIRNADEQDHWDEFWYLEQGYTLKIGVEERTFNGHSFPSVDTIHFKERAKDYDDKILDESPCLDDCLVIPEYEELQKVFMQSADKPARRSERDDDRGSERRERGGREERGSEREERSERRSRRDEREDPPAREERSERTRRSDPPDEPAREERRGRQDREERTEERAERGGREDKDAKDGRDKGGDDPWAARDRGRKEARDGASSREERSERRSRRDEPDEPPRVRSDEDSESRRERSERRDEPDEPRSDRAPKDFNDFKDRDRGGDREERGGRREREERTEERGERRSRR